MPTPTGLPQVGDLLRHKSTNRVFEVIKREGGSIDYSLVLQTADGEPLGFVTNHTVQGFRRTHVFRLLEAAFWLDPARGPDGYEFVNAAQADYARLASAFSADRLALELRRLAPAVKSPTSRAVVLEAARRLDPPDGRSNIN